MKAQDKRERLKKRHSRIRVKVAGNVERPRLSVFLSNKYIYTQLIDDGAGVTLVSASTLEQDVRKEDGNNCNITCAEKVGGLLAKRALEKGIEKVVFDRGGHKYHGRVKAIAESARKAGLNF